MSSAPRFPAPLLVIGNRRDDAEALADQLREAGAEQVFTGDCLTLVRQVADVAPQQVVCSLPEGETGLWQALGAWAGAPPCAVSVIAPWVDAAAARALVEAGVCAWSAQVGRQHLEAWLAAAQARHTREAALGAEVLRTRSLLDERKFVDRAKGLLMAARGIAEDDAFKLLRGTAMHANLKLGEVARAVIDSARQAEAVNRAGRLRMLSQRLVALAAQRLLRVDAARARTLQQQAAAQLQQHLEHLATLGLDGDAAAALVQSQSAWAALNEALQRRADAAAVARADERAEALLQSAQRLTAALEDQGTSRALAIVNLCGSQRMRTQRIVKDALLAAFDADAARSTRLHTTMDEFERVMREIEASPLSSPEIRAALDAARDGWLTLLRALRAADAGALVNGGDALLAQLERLTESCEHSLQVLLA